MSKRQLVTVSFVAACGLLASACAGSAASNKDAAAPPETTASSEASGQTTSADAKSEVVVGLLHAQSGPWAGLGTDINNGFNTYLKSHDGKLGGHPIVVKTADPGNAVAQASTSAHQLVERDKVQVVAGFINSALAYATGPYLTSVKVPLVITGAGADGLTQSAASPFVFRVGNSSSQPTLPLGDYTCKELKHTKATVIALDYSFGWEAAGGFARGFTNAGCNVVQEIYAPTGTQDWSAYVSKIDPSAEVVAMAVPGADGVRLLRAYRSYGVKLPIVAYGGTVDETVLPAQGETAKGILSMFGYSTVLDSPENAQFVKDYKALTNKLPNAYAEDGFAAAAALDAALEKIDGEVTSEAIVSALKGLSFNSARGAIQFDDNGQAIFDMYIREVSEVDGAWANKVVNKIPEVSQFWTFDPAEYMKLPKYEDVKNTWK